MSLEDSQVRKLTLYEGQVRWIMERETPEERLAAWETITALAFPTNGCPYEPPPIPSDGSRLSPCDRARRDVYNFFKDLLKYQSDKNNGRLKDIKKVAAGRLGAEARLAKRSESSTVENTATESVGINPNIYVPKAVQEDDFSSYTAGRQRKHKVVLTDEDKEIIKEWDRKIPDAKALLEHLQKNYLYQNRNSVLTDEFCEFAFQRLSVCDRWISTKTKRPLRDLKSAIYYISIEYMQRTRELKRVEAEEEQKDKEFQVAMQASRQSLQSSTELETLERKRRRAAEREAMEKVLRGEL